VVLCNGTGDAPHREMREMPGYAGWAKLLAGQGMAAVVPEAGLSRAVADMRALLRHLTGPGGLPGVDRERLGLWASSADAPAALQLLSAAEPPAAAAVILYGVGDAAAVPGRLPVLVVRAGGDQAGWNEALDRMLAQAEQRALPWTVLRAPGLRHAFDLLDGGAESWGVVRAAVAFLRDRLGAAAATPLPEEPPPAARGIDVEARQALLLWRARDWPAAAAAYRRWLGTHKGDGVASYRLGTALHMMGQHAEAAQALERAVRMGEQRPPVLYNLACARARAGQLAGAMAALEGAVREGFDDVEGMARDPDLTALRGQERFERLVGALRKGRGGQEQPW
jgi:tetratricopeptide (TPR) repeat protein